MAGNVIPIRGDIALLVACVEALRLHNQTPLGGTRSCLPGCVACAALAPLLEPLR